MWSSDVIYILTLYHGFDFKKYDSVSNHTEVYKPKYVPLVKKLNMVNTIYELQFVFVQSILCQIHPIHDYYNNWSR